MYKNLKIPKLLISHYKKEFDLDNNYMRRYFILSPSNKFNLLKEHYHYCIDKIIYDKEYFKYIFKSLINKWFNIQYNKRFYYEVELNELDVKKFDLYLKKYHIVNLCIYI